MTSSEPKMRSNLLGERGDAVERLGHHIRAELDRLEGELLSCGLYLVATPIGHLGDITVRALRLLMRADVIYAEDTRRARVLLSHYGITAKLHSYHEHNAERERGRILRRLGDGQRVALISDAGTPLVSDPGYKLVRAVISEGFEVFSLPGASASLAALSVAGLPTDCFMFAGFLSGKSGERRSRIKTLSRVPATLLFYESPSRLGATLADLADVLGARPAAVARELTKRYEEVLRGSLDELARAIIDQAIKGECVIVVGPPQVTDVSDKEIITELEVRLCSESLRDAAKSVARDLGVSKARVYDLGLTLKRS